MTLSHPNLVMFACLVVLGTSLSTFAQTPAPNTTEWENESLKLRLF